MLEVSNVSKEFFHAHQPIKVIDRLSLSVSAGQFVAIVGPSGCGKTTLLKILGGLLLPTTGQIRLEGKEVAGPGKDRGLVFQNFSLFPWLTVRHNIAFGPKLHGIDRQAQKILVDNYLCQTGLVEFADFYPHHLSGGMQQRVAIARTLANDPKIILMDEPFGALDTQTKTQMQEMLLALWEQEKKMIIFITHDVREALFLADTLYILSKSPATVKKIIRNPFPRPRIRDLQYSAGFSRLEQIIMQELH